MRLLRLSARVLMADLGALDFAAQGLRQLVDKFDDAGVLVGGCDLFDVVLQLLFENWRPLPCASEARFSEAFRKISRKKARTFVSTDTGCVSGIRSDYSMTVTGNES